MSYDKYVYQLTDYKQAEKIVQVVQPIYFYYYAPGSWSIIVYLIVFIYICCRAGRTFQRNKQMDRNTILGWNEYFKQKNRQKNYIRVG
jgi:hypothetical protein